MFNCTYKRNNSAIFRIFTFALINRIAYFRSMKKLVLSTFLFSFFSITVSVAQCAMCRATAESNLKDGSSSVGAGLNSGILYLMAIPYVMAAVGFSIWYFQKKKKENVLSSPN